MEGLALLPASFAPFLVNILGCTVGSGLDWHDLDWSHNAPSGGQPSRFGFEHDFGGGFFLLALLTSVAADVYRNRGVEQGTIEWNPALVWQAFLYLGAFFFLVSAFLAYHEGVWLSVGFVCFSIGSVITATFCFRTSSSTQAPD